MAVKGAGLRAQALRATGVFVGRAQRFATACGLARACVPFVPDPNLVCLPLNPHGNATIAGANVFVRRLHAEMGMDAGSPVQTREFLGSTTRCAWMAGSKHRGALRRCLQLAVALAQSPEPLRILRHMLMNPFLQDTVNGIDHIDRHFEFLERRVTVLAGAKAA